MSNHDNRVMETVAEPSSAAFSSVAASWCRSARHHGLDPSSAAREDRLTQAELSARREEMGSLIDVASPLIDQLFLAVGQTGCSVVLADSDGIILDGRAPDGDRELFESVALAAGGMWSEATEGTNGIGTCLAEGRAVTIHRDEHFASRNIGMSCMDAPIYDATGRLVAALDVSSCRDDYTKAMTTLMQSVVQDAARRIERALFLRHFAGRRIIDANEAGSDTSLVAVDRDDLLIGATRAARQRFSLTDACLTGNRTAAELFGDSDAASFAQSERATIRRALAEAGGNASRAAKALGIGRATLYRRMERVGLKRD